jgi:hypothetical protein
MADDRGGRRSAVGLGNFDVAGERLDEVAGEVGAVGRCQRDPLLAFEIIVQDQFVMVVRQHQVDAGSLELSPEQQLGVGDDNGIRRSMRGRAIDMRMHSGMRNRAVNRQLGVEFANEIQWATKKG